MRMNSPAARPVIFGEVLLDEFPGSRVPGGAPFNVASHLQGFGLNPLFISRIGDDKNGRTILARMQEWGMDISGVQIDPHHPTGRVIVRIDNTAQHSFEILPDQAYDFIDHDAAMAAVKGAVSLIYHGSLAARSDLSARTLRVLRDALTAPVFVDINLRAPWWTKQSCLDLMRGTNWLKLNEEELAVFLPLDDARSDSAETLRRALGLDMLILTRGDDGASLYHEDGLLTDIYRQDAPIIDTVGAGDAFAAVVILGLAKSWAPGIILNRALAFAAESCSHQGATIEERSTYDEWLTKWDAPRADHHEGGP